MKSGTFLSFQRQGIDERSFGYLRSSSSANLEGETIVVSVTQRLIEPSLFWCDMALVTQTCSLRCWQAFGHQMSLEQPRASEKIACQARFPESEIYGSEMQCNRYLFDI